MALDAKHARRVTDDHFISTQKMSRGSASIRELRTYILVRIFDQKCYPLPNQALLCLACHLQEILLHSCDIRQDGSIIERAAGEGMDDCRGIGVMPFDRVEEGCSLQRHHCSWRGREKGTRGERRACRERRWVFTSTKYRATSSFQHSVKNNEGIGRRQDVFGVIETLQCRGKLCEVARDMQCGQCGQCG